MSGLTWGGRAADRPASAGGFSHFLKTFREKSTPITFVWDNPGDNFYEYREHFDRFTTMPGARSAGVSYPCALDAGGERCIGHDFPVEHPEWDDEWLRSEAGSAFGEKMHQRKAERKKRDPGWEVRDPSGKWVFPAVTEEGYIALYKIGYNFWTHLKGVYDELGTITNQVFKVIKVGENFNDIAYSALPTGQPAKTSERDVPSLSDISNLLGAKYKEVFDVYVAKGLTNEDGTPAGAEPVATGGGDQAPAQVGTTATQKAEPTAQTPASDAAKERSSEPQYPKGLDELDVEWTEDGKIQLANGVIWDPLLKAREATPTQLKEWLLNDPRGAHTPPPRAPRGVLLSLVEKAQVPF